MPKYVEMPDGKVVEFPDFMSNDQMNKALTGGYKFDGGAESMSGMQKFMTGMGAGFENAGLGVMQRVLEGGEAIRSGLGMESNQQNLDRINQKIVENRRVMEPLKDSGAASAGEFVGNAAPYVAIPGGVTGGVLRRAGTAALSGGTVGALQPTVEGESAGHNALVGAALGSTISGGMSGAAKLTNAISGNVPITDPMVLAKKHGISITIGEATNNPLWKKAETWLETVPFIGLKSFREKQNAESQQAAKGFFARYVHDPSLTNTASMKLSNDAYLDNLYGIVKKEIKTLPSGEVPTVKKATGEMLERYPSVFESIQDTHIKRILQDVSGDVADKTVDTGLLNAQGGTIKRLEIPKFTAEELWELRKGLGKEIGDAKTDTARGVLNRIYSAVSDDMDTVLSQNNSPAVTAFRNANESFKQYSVKFDALREAYDKAAGTTKGGEMFSPKVFSTALKNLANDPNYKRNVKWSPQEIDEMTGLANILQVAKRGGQFMENPPTGNRWGPLAIGSGIGGAGLAAGGVVAMGQAVVGTAAVVGATRFLTTTTAGRRLALAASKVEPQSALMRTIVNQVMNQAPKFAATGATRSW